MNLYSALILLTVTIHVSVPEPKMQDPHFYGLNTCSGVFVSPTEILTAAHCVSDSRGHQWIRTSDEISYAVSIEKVDKQLDLALLKISKPIEHSYVELSRAVDITDNIYTVNSGEDFIGTYNQGVVMNKYIDGDSGSITLLHNALIVPGASGSGLFSGNGKLVGINLFVLHGLSGAISIEEVSKFVKYRRV